MPSVEGLGKYYSDFNKMMGKDTRKKIRNTDVLLFDEISMCSGHFFDVIECMVSIIRYYDYKDDQDEQSITVKHRVKKIKEDAPIVNENVGGSSDHERTKEDSIMSSYMLKMRWEEPGKGGLGDIPAWGGMQIICVGDFFQLPP